MLKSFMINYKRRAAWRFYSLGLLIGLCCSLVSAAQSDTTITDPDVAYKTARDLAFAGNREASRQLCFRILAKYPNYVEIESFAARTYAWDGNYEKARELFADVQAKNNRVFENYTGWSDLERWHDHYAASLAIVDSGLVYYKNDPELLLRKARLYTRTGKLADAKHITQQLLRKDRHNGDAYILLQELRSQLLYNGVAAGFSYEGFSKYYDPAYYSYVQGSKITRNGSIIARLNYANRFGKTSFQPEIDLYPKIYKSVYAYLNYGFSNGDLFPKHRIGAEIFTSLPKSFEASFGLRYLYFDPTSKVTIYTGSVGYYVGNYWLSLRPNITPDSDSTSVSASLTARRYFKNPEHYFSLRVGAGFSPELQNFQTVNGGVGKSFYNLKSQSIGISYQHPISKQWRLSGGGSLTNQEVIFNTGEYILNYGLSASLQYRFK